MSAPASARPPGRPRSTVADEAILRAALDLLAEAGYRALTMEAVRDRSGVGKATLYRRYGSKEELVRAAIVHLNIGKTSFENRPLLENYAAVIDEIIRAKPSAAKGRYIRTITLASTMGPGVKVDPSRTRDIVEEAAPANA